MRSRKVVITIEAETDAPLNALRFRENWPETVYTTKYLPTTTVIDIQQITVNVIKPRKEKP